GEGEFELRTLYNFQQRLSHYRLTHGVNLPEQPFEAITDRQRVALQVRSGMPRMDSDPNCEQYAGRRPLAVADGRRAAAVPAGRRSRAGTVGRAL
ncbi:MAG: hypothetical protein RMJ88_17095, partial [Thermogemmata sp.]|nr:hypothetical protein [Thermogemmata sp.]